MGIQIEPCSLVSWLAGWLAVAWLGGFEKGTLAAFVSRRRLQSFSDIFRFIFRLTTSLFLPIGISKHFVSGRRKERTDAPSIVVVWGLASKDEGSGAIWGINAVFICRRELCIMPFCH